MKLLKIPWLLAIAFSCTFASCKKEKTQQAETLPPITQTGANTFGCLINGKVYTPKGFDQNKPNFDMIVDPGFNDGQIDIRVFRKSGGIDTRIGLGSDSIRNTGYFIIDSRTDFVFGIYSNPSGNLICLTPYAYGNPSNKTGYLKITRYDLTNRIISGEFEFHFSNTACGLGDPIDITQGRFDKKF